MEFYAVRPIAKGEEILLSYCATRDTASERQNALKPYGFTCTCSACRNPEVSDKERERVVLALLPKTSQDVKHAEATLATFEATGLQRLSRYVELVRRVAQINRKYGKKQRAHELESLADRVAMAQVGRDPKPEPTLDTPAQNIMFDSGADMLKDAGWNEYIAHVSDAIPRPSGL